MLNIQTTSARYTAATIAIVCLSFLQSVTKADELIGITGIKIAGTVTGIGSDGTITGDEIPDGLNIQSLLSVKTVLAKQPNNTPAIIVRLAAGGELYATDVTVEKEMMEVRSSIGELSLPVESVRAIIYQPAKVDAKTRSALAKPLKDTDRVIAVTKTGSQSALGLLDSIVNGTVNFKHRNKMKTLSVSKVIAVVIADLGVGLKSGTTARCKLVDGSSVTGVVEKLENDRLFVQLSGAGKLEVDWHMVLEIAVISDRLIYLSDMEPIDSEHEPIVTFSMPWQRDTSVLGNSISLKSKNDRKPVVYPKGIGMHSYSRLVFARPKGFDRFRATVGIDVETEGKGNCIFIVRNDGIQVWSQSVKAGDEPVEIDLDVSEAEEVSIIVESGAQLDMGDHADWASARFLNTK